MAGIENLFAGKIEGTPIKLSPYIPGTIPKNKVYVSSEGVWHPDSDGAWPLHPFAFDRWDVEDMSWHDTCSLHEGLNPFSMYKVHGKEFLDLLGVVSVNTFKVFPVGKSRHTIICDENGKIMLDGIVIRRSEEDFLATCFLDPNMLNQMAGNRFHFESSFAGETNFFFQMCGPNSLPIVEEATRQDLHDLKFMYTADAKIDGKDVFVLRTGMAGTLGYEVHGSIEDAHAVYQKLLDVGKKYGIQEIGRHGYINEHCEGSIFQIAEHFGVPFDTPQDPTIYTGSLPRDSELIYRSPFDCGWGNLVKFNHDFIGKEALMAEAARPHNTAVHLIWNKEDVLKVQAGVMDPDKRYDYMDMVCDYDYVRNCSGIHIDAVYDGDRMIGASSGRTLVAKTREMISICTIAEEYAVEGKEVEVLWGNPGTNQVRIRATVTLFPYIKEGRNENFDTETIPHPVFD